MKYTFEGDKCYRNGKYFGEVTKVEDRAVYVKAAFNGMTIIIII